MRDAAADAPKPGWTVGLVLRNALALGANVLLLAGVLRWNWDAFQVLILFWCETGIAAFWALAKLYLLPERSLGTMTVNGKTVPATNRLLLEMFALVFGVFLAVHLGLLWVLFSEGSAAAVRGPVSFVRELVVASAAWAPLSLAFLAGMMDFVRTPKRNSLVLRIEQRLLPARGFGQVNGHDAADRVGAAVAAPLIRIVLMQVAVILGAMLVRRFGTDVPFYILIALKMLADIQSPSARLRS